MRYSRVLQCVLYVYNVAVLAVYFVTGDNPYVNIGTIALCLLLSIVLTLVLATLPQRSTEIELMFVTSTMLFLCSSIFLYLTRPADAAWGGTLRHSIVSVSDVNRALLFVVFGTILFVGGIRAGAFVQMARPRRNRVSPPQLSIPRLLAVGALLVTIELVNGVYFGRFSTDITPDTGGVIGLMMRFVVSDTFLLVAVAVAVHQWRRVSRARRAALLTGIAVVVAHRTLVGSRQALLTILLFGAATLFDRFGDFVVARRALIIVSFAVLGSLITFPIATAVRDYWNVASRAGHYPTWSEFRDLRDQLDRTRDSSLVAISRRLNGLDPIVAVASGHVIDKEKYISVPIVLKSFVNVVVPGTPWPEAREMSKTFLVAYLGYPVEYLDSYYVTTMWTLWGDSWAMFGTFGGLVWMFGLGAIVSTGFVWLTRRRRRATAFWRILFIYMIYVLTVSFGLDTVGASAIYMALPLLVTMTLAGTYRKNRPSFFARHVLRRAVAVPAIMP
jgi:hypothetical protein